jgi:DNA integrity scanning protein DisA with diadenylate cyclase activity
MLAARCVLPVSESTNFPQNLGMRHRAAVGITENTDAIAVSVSEQTGEISFSMDGQLTLNVSIDQLREFLEKELR